MVVINNQIRHDDINIPYSLLPNIAVYFSVPILIKVELKFLPKESTDN